MARAKTQKGAQWRVKRMRAIRRAGMHTDVHDTNKEVAAKYKRVPKKYK